MEPNPVTAVNVGWTTVNVGQTTVNVGRTTVNVGRVTSSSHVWCHGIGLLWQQHSLWPVLSDD